jgi:hypothetical protein
MLDWRCEAIGQSAAWHAGGDPVGDSLGGRVLAASGQLDPTKLELAVIGLGEHPGSSLVADQKGIYTT